MKDSPEVKKNFYNRGDMKNKPQNKNPKVRAR